jgi:hypothetical protein
MSTTTSRLLLEKPDNTDLYDVGVPNSNMDILDRVGGVTICTSSTRPNSPFNGMTIYESDTGQQRVWVPGSPGSWDMIGLGASIICTSSTRPSTPIPGLKIFETDTTLEYIWTGSAWFRLTPGLMGGKRYDTAGTLATVSGTTETLMGMDTGNPLLLAERVYRVSCRFEVAQSVLTDVWTVRLRQTNVSGTIWNTQNALTLKAAATKQQLEMTAVVHTIGSADGNRLFCLTAQRVSGTGTLTVTSTSGVKPHMLIELMGDGDVLTVV